jgi:hypothetical protein
MLTSWLWLKDQYANVSTRILKGQGDSYQKWPGHWKIPEKGQG